MRHRKITEHRVRTLRPKAQRYQITEDNLPIEVNPSGKVPLGALLHFTTDQPCVSVATSSNDLQVYWDAREWVNEKYPELIRIPLGRGW